jgi:hypothetical protein
LFGFRRGFGLRVLFDRRQGQAFIGLEAINAFDRYAGSAAEDRRGLPY